ncbi:dienelactone hydrolase family protein [Rhodococcus sp. NPDC056960]|uniref:dienelactone hydrolase family protein n=1 Tax=Rhodococcus sp. NPDC056960 TaxID=3345982 RepID=UPI00362A7581
MGLLDGWTPGCHTAGGITHSTYRRGRGPGVIVIHEVPGVTPEVIGFAEEVAAQGHTVVMPSLFGKPERGYGTLSTVSSLAQVCVSREFTKLARGRTAPVAVWLRSLARDLHEELGGIGVGAVGMCFTGGYALAMMVDAPVVAPVLAQPSAPFPVGETRKRDLGLSPADLDVVRAKVNAGCQVLGLRFQEDGLVGNRFETLRREFGDNFIAVEFPGAEHSTLTAHRRQAGVERVLAFFADKLGGPD